MKLYKYAVLQNDTLEVKYIAEFDDLNTMDGQTYPDDCDGFINIKDRTQNVEIGMIYNPSLDIFE